MLYPSKSFTGRELSPLGEAKNYLAMYFPANNFPKKIPLAKNFPETRNFSIFA
jgi:hypothetical protein